MTYTFNTTIFVLCAPSIKEEASLSTPVFIEFKEPVVLGVSPWGNLARLRSLSSLRLGSEPAWAPADSLLPDGDLTFDVLPVSLANDVNEMLLLLRSDLAMCALVRGMCEHEEGWDEFRDHLDQNRFTANVWFERDRKNVTLTDGLTSRDLVCLWDDDVNDAIESGCLTPPRGPRPKEGDWLEPLLQYAASTGALQGLSTRGQSSNVFERPGA